MSKKLPDYLTILDPAWQYECSRCGHVGEVCASRAEAIEDARNHDCVEASIIGLSLHRDADGIYRGQIGDPFIGYLLIEATVRESSFGEDT